jgi:hypothetical protein
MPDRPALEADSVGRGLAACRFAGKGKAQHRIRTRSKIGKSPTCAAIFLLRFSRREFSHRVGSSAAEAAARATSLESASRAGLATRPLAGFASLEPARCGGPG